MPCYGLIGPPHTCVSTDVPEMMRFENEKLREEMERLKRVLGPGPQGANEKLLHENALLATQVRGGGNCMERNGGHGSGLHEPLTPLAAIIPCLM